MKPPTLIEQIYCSQLHTYRTVKESNSTKQVLKKLYDVEQQFTKTIQNDEDLYRMYRELEDLQTEHLSSSAADAFYFGFKSGVQMILEATADKFTGDID